jgi:lactoylglutathione lyase
MTIEHLAVWVEDLEAMLAFYTEWLGGASGDLYENPATGLRSYFVSFGGGARLELMSRPGLAPPAAGPCLGYAHLAFRLGSRDAVDAVVAALRRGGVTVESGPRVTGDGYYEAVVLDPERNRVELVA